MKNATLSLVLPIHGGEANLAAVVQHCLLTVPRCFTDYEIIIVDDGSQDDTRAVAYELAVRHDPVLVIRHPSRRGYARSLIHGFRSARGDYLMSLYAGDQVGVHELVRLLPYLEEHELVQGYRLHQDNGRQRGGLVQRLINALLSLDMCDPDCRLSIMRADLLDRTGLRHTEPLAFGALIHTELYARARRLQAACLQVGVNEHSDSQSNRPARRWSRWMGSSLLDIVRLWLYLPRPASWKAPVHRLRAFGEQIVVGVGLAAIVRGVWLLLRRRPE